MAKSKAKSAKPKSKGSKPSRSSKKSKGAKVIAFNGDHLEKAGFTKSGDATGKVVYAKGNNRVEVSTINDEQHVKYFQGNSNDPIFHTNAGASPNDEFLKEFTK